MPILPFDESPPKIAKPTTSSGSLAYLKDQFLQGVYLEDDKAMYSNFAKIYSAFGKEKIQLNFGAGFNEEADVKESTVFQEETIVNNAVNYLKETK